MAETTQDDDMVAPPDGDKELEREGIESERHRGYDEEVRGQEDRRGEDVDPDSAEADIDRDDFMTD